MTCITHENTSSTLITRRSHRFLRVMQATIPVRQKLIVKKGHIMKFKKLSVLFAVVLVVTAAACSSNNNAAQSTAADATSIAASTTADTASTTADAAVTITDTDTSTTADTATDVSTVDPATVDPAGKTSDTTNPDTAGKTSGAGAAVSDVAGKTSGDSAASDLEHYRATIEAYPQARSEAAAALGYDVEIEEYYYAIADINGDDVKELVISEDGEGQTALYTVNSGEVVEVFFVPRHGQYVIGADGKITYDYKNQTIYQLKDGELETYLDIDDYVSYDDNTWDEHCKEVRATHGISNELMSFDFTKYK